MLAAGAALRERLGALETDLMQTEPDQPQPGEAKLREKLTTLSAMIDESDHAPTRAAEEVFAHLAERVSAAEEGLGRLLGEELGQFAERVRAAGVPLIVP